MSAEDVGSGLGTALESTIKFNPITAPFYFAGRYVQETLDKGADAKDAQERLEKQRKKQLDDQAAARAAAAAKAATSGQRVGTRSQFLSGVGSMGFGSGTTAQGLSTGNLFGN
jgi:hypothetical protein